MSRYLFRWYLDLLGLYDFCASLKNNCFACLGPTLMLFCDADSITNTCTTSNDLRSLADIQVNSSRLDLPMPR